jgi:hypothetical protein
MSGTQGIVTFKADAALRAALTGIRNRSEFIRAALLAALDSLCPLCKGTGILTINQRSHWQAFLAQHAMRECHDCHEVRLVCRKLPEPDVHRRRASGRRGASGRPNGRAARRPRASRVHGRT